MPGAAHAVISRSVYQNLPEWEQKFWKREVANIERYSFLPDDFNDKDYERYCLMPNKIYIPHGPTDEKFSMVPFASYYSRGSIQFVLTYYLSEIMKAISANRAFDSFALACVLAHFLQDSSHPIHAIDNRLVYQYFPPPKGKYWQMHRSLDSVAADTKTLRKATPHLLGLTLSEASFHAIAEYEKMLITTRERFFPLIQAFYSGNRRVMNRLVNECFFRSAELTASLWHTCSAIARQKFTPEEVFSLKKVPLTSIIPAFEFTVDPYFFTPLYNYACDEKGNCVLLKLKVKDAGPATVKKFRNGIAMTFGYIGYEIPPSIFRKLVAQVGLMSTVTKETEVSFKIVRSSRPPAYADFHTKLLDYGGPLLYDSGMMTEKSCAQTVVVELNTTTNFTLLVECPGKNKNTHALWVEPMLLK